ncbi:lectin-like domain-containing protein [Litoribacter populi]|uniref:lectin-like domain-containing protein n=1 Tax=Litoribacter populi TaxID=2598460 RepID=UPI0011813A3A|nr:hypothetical protein [Litoribacter populi]
MGKLYNRGLLICFALMTLAFDALGQSGFPYCEPFTGIETRAATRLGGNAKLTAPNPDSDGDGVLQLTPAQGNQNGYAYVDIPFSSKYGIKTSFEFFIYGGNGADGMTFFLFDAAIQNFHPGGYGGSLGYAPNTNSESNLGLSEGYIGIGLDVYGNYGNTIEGKTGGFSTGSTRYQNSVIIRGPQSDDYKFIKGVRTNNNGDFSLPQNQRFPLSSGGTGTERVTSPTQNGYRKAYFELQPNPNGVGYLVNMAIEVTTSTGNRIVEIFKNEPYPYEAPQNLKLGFAASTGGSNNNHEIRNVIVEVSDDSDLQDPIAQNKSVQACDGVVNIFEIKATEDVELLNDSENNFVRCLQLAENLEDFQSDDFDICTTEQCDPSNQNLNTSYGVFESDAEGGIIRFTPNPNLVGQEVTIYYTVTDNFGKTSEPKAIQVKINSSPEAIITTEDETTFYLGDKATLSANVGEGIFYQWYKDGEIIPNATDSQYEALESGNYHVITRNEKGCEMTSNVISITTNIPPNIEIDLVKRESEICQKEGKAEFNITNLFEVSYYRLIRSGQEIQAWTEFEGPDLNLSNLSHGEYTLLIYDRYRSIEFPVEHKFNIVDNRDISIELMFQNIKCYDGTTGNIRFNLEKMSAPRAIRASYKEVKEEGGGDFLDAGIISEGNNNVSEFVKYEDGTTEFPQGEYIFRIRRNSGGNNSNACYVDFNIKIQPPSEPLTASVIQELDVCPVNHVTVLPEGGWGEYTYEWSNGATSQTVSALSPGTYSVTVTDKEGCYETVDNIIVPENDAVSIEPDFLQPTCGASDGAINITSSNLDYARHELVWRKDDPQTGEIIAGDETGITNVEAGTYYLILNELVNGNCDEFVKEYELKSQPTPIEMDFEDQEICEGETVSFSPSISSGSTDYQFNWYRDSAKQQPISNGDLGQEVVYTILPDGTLKIEGLPFSESAYEYFVDVSGVDLCESKPDDMTKISVHVKPKPQAPLVQINGGYPRNIN